MAEEKYEIKEQREGQTDRKKEEKAGRRKRERARKKKRKENAKGSSWTGTSLQENKLPRVAISAYFTAQIKD